MGKRKLFGCAAVASAGIVARFSTWQREGEDTSRTPVLALKRDAAAHLHLHSSQLPERSVDDGRWAASGFATFMSRMRTRLWQPNLSYCDTETDVKVVGGTATGVVDTAPSVASRKTALSKLEFRAFTLYSVEKVSHNTRLYRFSLPSEEHETGLTVASCLVARAMIDGKQVTRPYTPVSLNHQRGYLDLMIKTYPQPGGTMSRHCAQLTPGDTLEMKGPFKKLEYKPNMYKKIGMLAGGTGITPMLQIIREILSNPEDTTEINLIFANVTEGDILLRDELEALQYLYPNFNIYYTLDKPPRSWDQGVGFVTGEMIQQHLPPPTDDTFILVCGPKGFINHIAGDKGPRYSQGPLKGLLNSIGYNPDQVYKF